MNDLPTVRKFVLTNGCKKRLVAFFGHTDDTLSELENNRQWVAAKENEDGSFKVQSKTHNGSDAAFVCLHTDGLFLALGITSPMREPKEVKHVESKAEKKERVFTAHQRLMAKHALEKIERDAKKRERFEAHCLRVKIQMETRASKVAANIAANPQQTAAQKAAYWAEQARIEENK